MCFGDTHFPYHNKRALEFLADTASTFKPDRIVNMGDLLDMYSVSAYPKSLDHPDSWTKELKKGRAMIKKLSKLFPNLEVLESNHDDRAYKKSRIAGVPREFLIPYQEVIGAPDSWRWHDTLTLTVDSTREQVFFAHTATGGAIGCAKSISKTVVLGHNHTKFGAEAFRPVPKKTIWGIDCGCLVSDKGSPFSYNKIFKGRPITGCFILAEGNPIAIPL